MEMSEAYQRVYDFFTKSGHLLEGANCTPQYKAATRALIAALPLPESAGEDDMRTIFEEIIIGNLEWSFHQSDGSMKMSECAFSAVGRDGYFITKAAAERISRSRKPYWTHTMAKDRSREE